MIKRFIIILALILFSITVNGMKVENLTIIPSIAYTTSNLDCSWVIIGPNETYDVNITWYKWDNGGWIQNKTKLLSSFNNTLYNTTTIPIPSSITVKYQKWNCSILAYNGTLNASDSKKIEIRNSPPEFAATEITWFATEREFFSQMFSANDADNDAITYSLDSVKIASLACFGGPESSEEVNFVINQSGALSFNASRNEVGNYSVVITAMDNDTISQMSVKLNLTFSINCSYRPPGLQDIPNQTVEFNSPFLLQVQKTATTDAVNLTYQDNATFFDINSSTGLINFTVTNISYLGEHIVNISVNDGEDEYDPGNYSDFKIVKFVIAKPPVINWTNITITIGGNQTSYFNISGIMINASENKTIILFNHSSFDDPDNANANITDYNSNLTYSWKLNGIERSNNSSWLFKPGFEDAGSYNVTLEIKNIFNFTASKNWSIFVEKTYRQPIFLPDIRPRLVLHHGTQSTVLQLNITGNDTFICSDPDKNYGDNRTLRIGNSCRALILFDINGLSNITDAELELFLVGENATTSISVHRVATAWSENITTWNNRTENQTWSSPGGDYGAAIDTISVGLMNYWYRWNVTPLVIGWSNGTWNNTGMILIANSTIQKSFASSDYKQPIPDQTLVANVDTITDIYLADYFLELDGENLTYTYQTDSNYLSINFSGDNKRVIFQPLAVGETYVIFNATNPGNETAESNRIKITIQEYEASQTTGGTTTIVRWSTGTYESIKKVSLDIVINPIISMKPGEKLLVPLTLRNNGEVALKGINLLTSEVVGIKITLADEQFDELLVGEEAHTNLTLRIQNATPKRYNITIIALVENPALNSSAMIYIDVKTEEIEEKIRFAKDMFEKNPECLELMETLNKTEEALRRGDYERARAMVRSAIDNCKALIRYKKEELPTPLSEEITRNMALIMISAIVAMIIGVRIVLFKSKK